MARNFLASPSHQRMRHALVAQVRFSMWYLDSPHLQSELESRVRDRTSRRVRNLAVEIHPGRVVIRGQTATYYVKQLAQHGVQDLLPEVRLENTIVVDGAGLPPVTTDLN